MRRVAFVVLAVTVAFATIGLVFAVVGGAGAETPTGAPRPAGTDRPSRVTGRLIVDTAGRIGGATAVTYQGSTAECGFLHDKYPAHVPAENCSNIATLTSVDTGGTATRTVAMCSSFSCDAWHADLTFTVAYGPGGVRPGVATCHYGGLAYVALKDWTSSTGAGTAESTVAADFFVIIDGIPVTVEWHVRARNAADGSWSVVVYHT
jgi:hypothetical protein